MLRLTLLITLLFSLLPLAKAAETDKPKVVTTTTQAADLVNILAGDLVQNFPLMGAGVDPHLYQPTEADIRAMNEADAVIYSGLHLEGQFDQVFQALGERGVITYPLAQPVKDAGFIFGGFTLSESLVDVDDPHFWFDPRNWELSALGLADVLGRLDPPNAAVYRANAQAYAQELQILYDWALEAMTQISPEQRVLVTSHDAFQYFGDAFGWEVRGLQGISTEDEAGVADIQNIAAFVTERQIPVLFVESSVPPNAIRAVQAAIKAGGFEVKLGVRELYSDAMGEPNTFGGTYTGMIAQNVITVLQSFNYPVPPFPAELSAQPPAELLEMES